MSIRSIRVWISLIAFALATTPASAAFNQQCSWGTAAPAVHAQSVNVISTPVVLNLIGANHPFAHIAFISYESATNLGQDSGGVLRVMDRNCVEVARFPDAPGCPLGPLGSTPDLAPVSGIAAGDLDRDGRPEIVAVIGGGSIHHRQLAAFNFNGVCLVPKWISPNSLPATDSIEPSAPAIAQLDRPGGPALSVPWDHAEIIIDNKIYNSDGSLRFTGFTAGSLTCGGVPCPRSRTAIVAKLAGHVLPQIITGRGIYRSQLGTTWKFGLPVNLMSSMSNTGLTYPAVAELDQHSPGPEIVVVDTVFSPSTGVTNGKLSILSSTGATLAERIVSTSACGGPPMIGNADGVIGPEIGVATCDKYTLYQYHPNTQQINVVWTQTATNDGGGQTTSTLYQGPNGTRIVYADETQLYVLDGASGTVVQHIPNSSGTAFEGPVVASFLTSHPAAVCRMSPGSIIVVSNTSNGSVAGGTDHGVRIFSDPGEIGDVGSCWNEHAFHATNVQTGFGLIPQFEQPSWTNAAPAHNTYRVPAFP